MNSGCFLLVEPSRTVSTMLAEFARETGFAMTYVSQFADVKAKLSQHFDFILLSNQLDKLSGAELCQRIRAMPLYRDTPIKLLTNEPLFGETAELAFRAGITQIITRDEISRLLEWMKQFKDRSKKLIGRVLIIEDSPSQQDFIRASLSELGLSSDVVDNAEDALQLTLQHAYDLLLVDLVLAGQMTGIEFIQRVRCQSGRNQEVRILAMSGYGDVARRVELFNAGVDDFIGKPVVTKELHARIRGLLSQHYIGIAEQDSKQLRNSLATILENSPELIIQFDPSLRITYVNQKMADFLANVPEALQGKAITTLKFSQTDDGPIRSAIQQALDRKLPVELSITGHNGREYEMGIVPDVMAQLCQSLLLFARDVTEQRQMQRSLEQSEQAAVSASQAKSEFLAVMSHELRTPLHAISGFQQILRKRLQDQHGAIAAELAEPLSVIADSSRHLLAMINDILSLARLESQQLALQIESFSPQTWLTEVINSQQPQAQQCQVQLQLVINEPLPKFVSSDKGKLTSVLNSLLSNAIKFSQPGQLVKISAALLPAETLQLTVSDQGVGIAEDDLVRIWAPFTQGDTSSTRAHGGSGLGLTLVEKFLQLLGGQVSVHSKLGLGSQFVVTVPVKSVQEPQIPEPAMPVTGFAGQRILLAEDSLVNQQVISAYCQQVNLHCLPANNGHEALAIAQTQPVDLILMDLHMPQMDGMTACRLLKADDKTKHIPIVGLSADAYSATQQQALSNGMDEYLTKPIVFDELSTVLARYLPTKGVAVSASTDKTCFDAETGIKYSANNSKLYGKLLQTFLQQYQQSDQDLSQLLSKGEVDEGMRLAHSLKGVAATLGMPTLSEIAKHLQSQLKDGQAALAVEQLPILTQALSDVVGSVNHWLAEHDS